MRQYLDILKNIKENGVDVPNRTGIDTRMLARQTMRFDLTKGFPIITTKKLNFDAVKKELLWFIRGCSDNKELQKAGVHIWDDNASAPYWKPKAKYEGDLGRIYGVQWRQWRAINDQALEKLDAAMTILAGETKREEALALLKDARKNLVITIDQLANVIKSIKNDPHGRRHIITTWNPGEIEMMALPPCHGIVIQFFVAEGKLSCAMYQRSCDMFLGVPFNISSYALLLSMVAQATKTQPYELIHDLGDAHIYHNHFQQVETQSQREPMLLPRLWLNPDIENIDDFKEDDIRLINYQHHPFIKAEMAV